MLSCISTGSSVKEELRLQDIWTDVWIGRFLYIQTTLLWFAGGTKTSIILPGSGEGSTDVEIVYETVPHGIHNK